MAGKDPVLTNPAGNAATLKPLGGAKPAGPPADKTAKESSKDAGKDREKEKAPAKPQELIDGKIRQRLTSIDAYRGFVMLAMASAGFGFPEVAKTLTDSWWPTIARQFQHVAWTGCSCWDLIQPSFMFLVGVAVPFSYAARRAQGRSYLGTLGHALVRCVILVLLAILLSSQLPHTQTEFKFTNVLAQIGLGYMFVFLLVNRGIILQTLVLVGVLAGYGYLFYQHPLPGPDVDYAAVGAEPEGLLPGEQAHWNQNTNFAAAVDRTFLNWFPRKEPFRFDRGGYCTLNFVPSIATMLLGLMAGELLRGAASQRRKIVWLLIGGAVCMAAGLALGLTIVPIVKKIWTPSWVLVSGAAALWTLALFYWVVDVRGFRRLAYPLVVVGANSILMYLMSMLMAGWVFENLKITFGESAFTGTYGPIVHHTAVLAVLWLICFWLYRQRAFIKI
jgi:predicted acyltransferase